MDPKEKIKLIRQGNELFNKGEMEKAKEYFIKAKYDGGIRRIADYYFYDKKDILSALPLYIKCKNEEHIEESYKRIALTIQKWIKKDEKTTPQTKEPKVSRKTAKTKNKDGNISPIKKPTSVEEQIKKQLLKQQQNLNKNKD